MPPFLFFILAIITPFGFVLTLFVPIYVSIFGAAYLTYKFGPQGISLAEKFSDVFYIINVYDKLFQYWRFHMFEVSFFTYSLPVVGLPFVGFFFALWLTRRFIRKVGDIFHFATPG